MQLFNPNNTFFRWIARLTDVVGLSLLWAFLSVPIVTVGSAAAGLYDSVRLCVRTGESGAFARFFATFRASFRRSAVSSLVWGAIWIGLWLGLRVLVLMAAEQRLARLQLAIFCVLLLVPAGIVCWLPPLCARSAYRALALNVNAARLTLAHLPRTVLAVALVGLTLYLCWRYWFPLLFLPSLCALALYYTMEPVFCAEGLSQKPGE